jgi:peptidoglycan/xylan/chitin deacetylase (PgdA/CDA1 family)
VGLAAAGHLLPVLTTVRPLRVALFPRLSGRGSAGHVALTFDDGPDDVGTPVVLDTLAALGVRATFFLLGVQVARHATPARAVVAAGHEVGVHGWDHTDLRRRGPAAATRDLSAARARIAATTGTTATLFRPAYGVLTGAALWACRRVGLRPVLWTDWGRDWEATATPESVQAAVVGRLRGGGTVLLHDSDVTSATGSWQVTVGALPGIVEHCRSRGWSVGPLRDHQP